MAQKATGTASDVVRELAEELIPFIMGEKDRALEQMQAGGPRSSYNERHERLVSEITAKIKAIIGNGNGQEVDTKSNQ